MYKIRKDLSISHKDKEILTIEIISKENKNMLLSCYYRPPNLTAYLFFLYETFTRVNIKFTVTSHISTMICLRIKKIIKVKK